jgi:L-arabinonolactonase
VDSLHLRQWRSIVTEVDNLGECPVWDEVAQRLWWIDVTGKRISSCDAAGNGLQRISVSDHPGCLRLRSNGGLIVAYRRGIALTDEHGREVASAPLAPHIVARERFNDGACDALGRLWVGTMDRNLREPVGGLYRVDSDLSMHRLTDGICVSNGIAWSPNAKKLYQCDSAPRPRIWVHDFDLEAGVVYNRQVFVEYPSGATGGADGCVVDSEGYLWVASPRAGKVLRFDCDGRVVQELRAPVLHPSAVTFGGQTLRTLFLTSMRPATGSISELDGALFAADLYVAGSPTYRFMG